MNKTDEPLLSNAHMLRQQAGLRTVDAVNANGEYQLRIAKKRSQGPFANRKFVPHFVSLLMTLPSIMSCAHHAKPSTVPQTIAWPQTTLDDLDIHSEIKKLKALAASTKAEDQLLRLHLLLDLFDHARLSGDSNSRQILWASLGGRKQSRGSEATREASMRLMQEGWNVESQYSPLPENLSQFLADFIMITSTDMYQPSELVQLEDRLLAYRTLVEQGHPQIADNARLRLYDHIVTVMEKVVEVDPYRKMDIAAHALLAKTLSIKPFLESQAKSPKPDYPSSIEMWTMLKEICEPLHEQSRWQSLVDLESQRHQTLHDTFFASMPVRREKWWPTHTVPSGTGHPEHWGPALVVTSDQIRINPGESPEAKSFVEPQQLKSVVESVVAVDGRGTLLLAIDPIYPSQPFLELLQKIAQANVNQVEFAVSESSGAGSTATTSASDGATGNRPTTGSIRVLPLQIGFNHSNKIADRPFLSTRVNIVLSGSNILVQVDGQTIASHSNPSSEFATDLDRVHLAYPLEKTVRVAFESGVLPSQLIDLLSHLLGGESPLFSAAGWIVDKTPSAKKSTSSAAQRIFKNRQELASLKLETKIEQPYPLKDEDQQRLLQFATRLQLCIPELQTPRFSSKLMFNLEFSEGSLRDHHIHLPKLKSDARRRLRTCIEDLALGFRLRDHRDHITFKIRFTMSSTLSKNLTKNQS